MPVRPGKGMGLLLERWAVLRALQFSSLILLKGPVGSPSEDLFKPLLSKYQLDSINLDQNVWHVWVYHDSEVCR